MHLFLLFDWLILLTLFFLYRVYGLANNSSIHNCYQEKNDRIFIFFSCVIFAITAFRHPGFGGPDTINYALYAEGDESSYYYAFDEIKDVGFIAICGLFRLISTNHNFFIFWSSCFILVPILYAIYRFSGDKLLSLTFFAVTMPDIWLTSMCAIRQFFAIAIVVWSFIVYHSKFNYNKQCSLLLLFFSCLIHSSNFFLIPILIICYNRRIKKSILFIGLLITWISIAFSNVYSDFMNVFSSYMEDADDSLSKYVERYAETEDMVEKNSLNMLPLNILPACLLYYVDDDDDCISRKLVQLVVVGFCLYNILCKTAIGARMTSIFVVIATISIPHIKKSYTAKYYNIIFILLFYMCWRTSVLMNYYTSLKQPFFTYSLFSL